LFEKRPILQVFSEHQDAIQECADVNQLELFDL
jgi:hypothetical protein